jgi:hypothetical protein
MVLRRSGWVPAGLDHGPSLRDEQSAWFRWHPPDVHTLWWLPWQAALAYDAAARELKGEKVRQSPGVGMIAGVKQASYCLLTRSQDHADSPLRSYRLVLF